MAAECNVYQRIVASVFEIAVSGAWGNKLHRVGRNRHRCQRLLRTADRAEDTGELAWQHGDPFDRLLVVQAMRHGFVLVTADKRHPGVRQLAGESHGGTYPWNPFQPAAIGRSGREHGR